MKSHLCPKCCSPFDLDRVDGSDPTVDGMPGIKYDVCRACGYMRAVTVRPKREKLNKAK